ncbi:MAG: DUF1569 domain-containing protein [Planctomycetales bacterium]|nr:DUF1569 domain-containing protein [Planctomycetales bacterium]
MERRHLRYAHLHEAVADAKQLSLGYTPTGGWDLAQNLSHLNKSMRMAIEGMAWGLPKFIRPLMRWWFLGRMERLGSQAIKMKAKAPPELQPDHELDLDEQLAEFERLAELLESPDTPFVDCHPVFGKMTRAQWMIMQRWHAAHHLSFLVPQRPQS